MRRTSYELLMDILWTSSDEFLNDRNRESIPDEHRIRTVKIGNIELTFSSPPTVPFWHHSRPETAQKGKLKSALKSVSKTEKYIPNTGFGRKNADKHGKKRQKTARMSFTIKNQHFYVFIHQIHTSCWIAG